MKILHCCLAAFYIDNYGYQENILPKMHALQGHDVSIIASTEIYTENKEIGYVSPSSYISSDHIPVTRLAYASWLPHFLAKKLRIYPGLYKLIQTFNPDIIFIHDVQFLSILSIVKYAKKNNVTIFVDGHADFINSARNWISKNLLHKFLYRFCAQKILPFTKKFYGVLPLRVDFIKDVYKIPSNKVELLLMGGDLTDINFDNKEVIRSTIRSKYNISDDDFLIISGGKIDLSKNIHLLIEAVHNIKNKKIHLMVFGDFNHQVEILVHPFLSNNNIHRATWLTPSEISNYFLAADLSCFPGTHSVLWEQSIALGLPGIFRTWPGMQHLDVGGNVIFINEPTVEKIEDSIMNIFKNPSYFNKMKFVALEKGIKTFSYYEIAQKAIL